MAAKYYAIKPTAQQNATNLRRPQKKNKEEKRRRRKEGKNNTKGEPGAGRRMLAEWRVWRWRKFMQPYPYQPSPPSPCYHSPSAGNIIVTFVRQMLAKPIGQLMLLAKTKKVLSYAQFVRDQGLGNTLTLIHIQKWADTYVLLYKSIICSA